jgi:pimeloyl-ACP methyl ester carboxylesterase
MQLTKIPQVLTALTAVILALFVMSFSFSSRAVLLQKYKQQELKAYAQKQWESPASVHKVGPSDPKFVVLFVHGFLGFEEFGWQNGWNEYVGRFVPALQGLSYVVYHPGLNQSKDYQSFAQGLDIYQVQQHLEKVIQEVDKSPEKSSLGGHSVSRLPIVCVGHSNGAATLVSLVSQDSLLVNRISSLILLAPYADLREASTLAKIKKTLPAGEFIAGKGMRLLYAPMYDSSELAPVDYVTSGKFPIDLPALFIYSHNDHVVPFKNSTLFKNAFTQNSMYAAGLAQILALHSGGHAWVWKRVRMTHKEIDKKNLPEDVKKHERRIKHQSYLSPQDRSELSAAVHNFIKKYVLISYQEPEEQSSSVVSRFTKFVKGCFS